MCGFEKLMYLFYLDFNEVFCKIFKLKIDKIIKVSLLLGFRKCLFYMKK